MQNEPTKENKWQETPPAKPATSGRKTGSPAASPGTDRSDRPSLGDLGFTRIPAEEDPRRNSDLLAAIAKVAPGTELRQAVDDVIRSHEGALIVVGDPEKLAFLYSGGIQLNAPFRSQLLYELAKMDGAIIVDEAIKRLAWANVQLMPDPTIRSDETGTRHRTAERVAKQTGALVISVSQQRETVTIFVGPARYQLDPVADVLAKTNQALGTLDTYRQRLEQVLTRLTALEFQNAVVLDDVLVVLQRAEMISRMAQRITRDCVELGSEGRLIRLQLAELVGDVAGQRDAIVRDYHVAGAGEEATAALGELAGLKYQELLEFGRLSEILGYDRGVNPLDQSVVPRGYRILSHIPRLPEPLVRRVVAGLGSLDAVVRASQRELESVEGVGAVRAREIREGLRRLQEHNLVDRYLQL
jgi:diadenylate cyclase